MIGFRSLLPALAAAATLLAAPIAGAGESLPENQWSHVARPSQGPPVVIGGFAHGCISGAVPLPADGTGYEVIHLSRKRYFGHPTTVAFVERLGQRSQAAGLPAFMVGDMAQPRGGPLPYGHASHQTGLDVDIWFDLQQRPLLQAAARETIEPPSMLRADWRGIDPKKFGARQAALLRLAATDPRVERIFVNPQIKLALCRGIGGARGDRAWLQRLRPWWGHDDHFHVRLRCPEGSPECEAQAPIPPGDGCDATLASWARHETPPPPHPVIGSAPRREPALPAACTPLLAAPGKIISLP